MKKRRADGDHARRLPWRFNLPAGNWWYLLSLFVPLLLIDVLLTGVRSRKLEISGVAFLDSLRPTLAFHLGLIIFWALLLAVTRDRRARRWVASGVHATFTILSALVVVTHLYFLKADLILSLETVRLVQLLFDSQIAELVAGEVSPLVFVVSAIIIGLANVVPPWLNRWFTPRWLTQPLPRDAPTPGVQGARWVAVALVVLGVLSVLPDSSGFARSNRNRAVGLALDAAASITGDPSAGSGALKPADLPLETRLVGAPRSDRPNVVLILVESLSAHATSIYNEQLTTTPRMEELSRGALVADRAFTVIPHTTKALIAAHCGFAPPIDTFSHTADERGGLASRCLPSMLAEKGYATGYFQSAIKDFEEREPMVRNFGFRDFFSVESFDKEGFSAVNAFGHEDDIMVEPSLEWAEEQEAPFFMSYLTVTTHYDYTLPEGFPEEHYSDDSAENRYLNGVRYSDRFVGKVVDGFKEAGLFDNTIFIVTGDHGEAFYEHGRRSHNDVIWTEGTHIPMIISTPESRMRPGRIVKSVQLPGLLPTVADLLDFRITGGAYPQPSMLSDEEVPLYLACWDEEQCVSIVKGSMKFNHFFGWRPDEYHDLSEDPGEERNIIGSLTEAEHARLVDEAKRWLARIEASYEVSQSAAND